MPTSDLVAARIPDRSYSGAVYTHIANAIADVEASAVPRFANSTDRDTKYSLWAAATGRSLEAGMLCSVGGVLYLYGSGQWRPLQEQTEYYDSGPDMTPDGTTIGTSPLAPPSGSAVAVPAGTYVVDLEAEYVLSTSTANRQLRLHLFRDSVDAFSRYFTVRDAQGVTSRSFTTWTRLTLASAATLSLRVSANAAGGTQHVARNQINARRVA